MMGRKGRLPSLAQLSPPSASRQGPQWGLLGPREKTAGCGLVLELLCRCRQALRFVTQLSTAVLNGENGWVMSVSYVTHPEEHWTRVCTCLWTTGRDGGKLAASGPAACQGTLTPTFHRAMRGFREVK